jgi:hypothetical protein
VSGYERVGQSTPKYMATGERQSVGFPVDSGFATACIYNLNNLFTLLESRNAATNFVTGRVSIENDMLK